MSFDLRSTITPNPTPTRSFGFFLSCDKKENICYCSNRFVYIRNLEDHLKNDIFTGHKVQATAAAFSPNGNYVASGDKNGELIVWSATNEDKTIQIESRPASGDIVDITWTGDNQRISVIAKSLGNSFGCCMNATTGSDLGHVAGHSKQPNSGCLKPNTPYRFVSAGEDFAAVFYTGPPFRFNRTIKDHKNYISCVRYSPDGSLFATCGFDGNIIFYDGKEGTLKNQYNYESSITCISFSPDSRMLLASFMSGKVLVINVEDGGVVEEYNFGSEIHLQQSGVLWTPKYKLSVSLNGDINYLDGGKIDIYRSHTTGITCLCKFDSGIITGDSRGMILARKFDQKPYAAYKPGTTEDKNPSVIGIAILGSDVYAALDNKKVVVMNLDDLSVKSEIVLPSSALKIMAVKDFLLVHCSDEVVVIRDNKIKKVELSVKPTAICASPDGNELAFGDAGGTLYFADYNGKVLDSVKNHSGEVCAIAYSNDGRKVASTAANVRDINVWDRANLKEPIVEDWRFHSQKINRIRFHENGVNLITSANDRAIRMWSLNKKVKSVEQYNLFITCDFDFISPGKIVTVGDDGCIRTWDLQLFE